MKGLAATPEGRFDKRCVSLLGKHLCKMWAASQNYNETMFSALAQIGYA